MSLDSKRCWSLVLMAVALFAPPAAAQEVKDAQEPATSTKVDAGGLVITPFATPEANRAYVRTKMANLQRLNRLQPNKTPPKDGPVAPIKAAAVVAPVAQLALGAAPLITESKPLKSRATRNITGEVCEPSVAVSRRGEILYSGNWFAAFTRSGADTLDYKNPARTFPESSNVLHANAECPFCCDQVVLYDPTNDMMIWFLQYAADSKANFIRVAVSSGDNIAAQKWAYFDFSPKSVGNWDNEWFDFPDMALSKKNLYITSNTFSTRGTQPFTRAVVLRLPLEALKNASVSATPVTIPNNEQKVYSRTDAAGFRPTQGIPGTSTVYFGNHRFAAYGTQLEVMAWSDSGSQPTAPRSVTVQQWSDPRSNEDYRSICKDGHAWLNRADSRITAAWATSDRVGFAWTAPRRGGYTQPHVRVALLSVNAAGEPQIADEPHLWNREFAVAYPSAAVNPDGEVGLAVCTGGGSEREPNAATARNPGLSVGVLVPGTSITWKMVPVNVGDTIGPASGLWGDYAGVRPDYSGTGKGFVTTGFAMPALLDSGARNTEDVVPWFVRFNTGSTGGGTGGTGDPGGTGGGVTDNAALVEKVRKLRDDADKLRQAADQLKADADAILNTLGQPAPKSGAVQPRKGQ